MTREGDSMFCTKCGTNLPADCAFCPNCGERVSVGGAASAPEPPASAHSASATERPAPVAAVPGAYPPAPYGKAPLGARLAAVIADGIIAAALLPAGVLMMMAAAARDETSAVGIALAVLGALWQVAYILGRDAFGGAGPGKRLAGLMVLSTTTGRAATAGPAIVRQLVLYAVQVIPVLGSLIEPVMVIADKEGKRLGDKAAKTHVVSRAAAQATGAAGPAGKGAAAGILVISLVMSLAGGALGGIMFARAASSLSAGLSAMETPGETAPTESATPAQPVTDEAPAEQDASQAVPDPLTKETAVDAVGNLLNYLKGNDVEAARAYATRNFQEEKDWFFAPAGGALASFEVTDAYQDQALWVVEVTEDWISGPQKSRYFVIVEDNTPRVDDVDHLEQ